MDGRYISTYGRDNPWEDLAESVLPWVAITYRAERQKKYVIDTVQKTMPNRIKYLDSKLSIEFVKPDKEFKFVKPDKVSKFVKPDKVLKPKFVKPDKVVEPKFVKPDKVLKPKFSKPNKVFKQ